jgi:hypothetical protein
MKLPFIFIFDINSIIGNLEYVIEEFEILKIIHKNCKIENILNNCITKINITDELINGLLRPYFKDFIDFIKNKYKTVEFYIYSPNYSTRFINNGIIADIEKVSNIHFNKPYILNLLDDTINLIFSNLISKYPSLKIAKNKSFVIENQLLYFSNNINKTFENIQLITPKYDYKYYYDIKLKIINKYLIKEDVFNNKEVLDYFDDNCIPIYNKNGTLEQQDNQIQIMLELYLLRKLEINNKNINDTYFNNVILLLKKKRNLKINKLTIAKINENFK